MTVSTSSIWKSVTGSLHQPSEKRDTTLHIGNTLRDLYRTNGAEQPDRFDTLLNRLDAVERHNS